MKSDLPERKPTRIEGYDYSSPGAYFVTVCCKNRKRFLGDIIDGEMRLNQYGEIARDCWLSINDHFTNVHTDEFIIMPDHFHGIVLIIDTSTIESVGDGSPVPLDTRKAILPETTTGEETSPLRIKIYRPEGQRKETPWKSFLETTFHRTVMRAGR